MALKEENGTFNGLSGDLYHQIGSVTGMSFGDNSHAHIRKKVFSSEEFREENPEKPLSIEMEDFPLSKEASDKIMTILYEEAKKKQVLSETINHDAETDEDGDIVKDAWTEEIFDFPYKDMLDC